MHSGFPRGGTLVTAGNQTRNLLEHAVRLDELLGREACDTGAHVHTERVQVRTLGRAVGDVLRKRERARVELIEGLRVRRDGSGVDG